MSIQKKFLKDKDICKVTFLVTSKKVEKVEVFGSFNNWKGIRLKKRPFGVFKKNLKLPMDQSFEFKYRIDGTLWVNDREADDYINNEFGGKNCVLTTFEV